MKWYILLCISTIAFSCSSIMDLRIILLSIFAASCHGKESLYELALSDEDVFSACKDVPPGTLDVHGFVDLSEFSRTLEEDGIGLSGNVTFVWDIQPQDRVKMVVTLLYFDRGTWTPTFYTIKSNDFCNSLYDSSQSWYHYWSGHVRNVEDVRDKCIYPGTKLIFEPYLMSPSMNLKTLREGLYKLQHNWQAFDSDGVERPTSICFDILGNLQKLGNV